MSRNIHIFVDTPLWLTELAKELGDSLSIELKLQANDREIWFEYINEKAALMLASHTFENDRDMNFEDYAYDLEIRPLKVQQPEMRIEWLYEFSHGVFEKLQSTGRYRLMLIDDLQKKLAEFTPF